MTSLSSFPTAGSSTPNEPVRADVGVDGFDGERARSKSRERTCVGCGEQVDLREQPEELMRLVLADDGEVAVDGRGGGFGRGAHVHVRRACIERAARAGLLKATQGRACIRNASGELAPLTAKGLADALLVAIDRRVEGMIAAAARSKRLAVGADAVTGACRRGDAKLVVVACDAAAAAELTEVRRAVAEGHAVAWGTKRRLGGLVRPGRPADSAEDGPSVGVLALTSLPLARSVQVLVSMADPETVPQTPPVGASRRNLVAGVAGVAGLPKPPPARSSSRDRARNPGVSTGKPTGDERKQAPGTDTGTPPASRLAGRLAGEREPNAGKRHRARPKAGRTD